jgi:hypothetical protein
VDFAAIAEATEQARELVNAVVAGFMADGFTPDQARRLAVEFLAPIQSSDSPEPKPGE